MERVERASLRSLAYRFLAAQYLSPPQPAWLAGLVREGLLDEFPVPLGNPEMLQGRDLIAAACKEPDEAALSDDYQRIFVGPAHLPAPPWESVYRTEEHLIFDWPTLEVRAAYKAMGLQVEHTLEPDDHIGLELLFMAVLTEQEAAGEAPAAAAQQTFLKDHLLTWAPTFCTDLAAGAKTDLFRGLALLTRGMLEQERELLGIK